MGGPETAGCPGTAGATGAAGAGVWFIEVSFRVGPREPAALWTRQRPPRGAAVWMHDEGAAYVAGHQPFMRLITGIP
ncbi:hypothetical protein GCM10023322_78910 [Rugosimonospora acidiphila]|uniref:Uncharacterized protein n=1 Tax=Rugosimonospora acidiphila TaxID=556531 RepID=A0ABP9SSS4_9ACTN